MNMKLHFQKPVKSFVMILEHMQHALLLCSTFLILIENMRQQVDITFIDILNLSHIRKIKSEHIASLTDRVCTNFIAAFSIE